MALRQVREILPCRASLGHDLAVCQILRSRPRHAPDARQLERRMTEVDAGDQPEEIDLEAFVEAGGHADEPASDSC